MQVRDRFQYLAEINSVAGTPLGKIRLFPDWVPAVEFGHLQGIRKGRLPPNRAPGRANVRPLWDAHRGAPYVDRVQIDFYLPGGTVRVEALPVSYLRSTVQTALASLIDGKTLRKGDRFHYKVCAYLRSMAIDGTNEERDFTVEPVAEPLPLGQCDLVGLTAQSRPYGKTCWDAEDLPVFIHARVLSEAGSLAKAAGKFEAGGILLGRLVKDPLDSTLFMEVTAQVPARKAVAAESSLRFTAETWGDVRAALTLRDSGEYMVGWHHSHPAHLWPCRECAEEKRLSCPSSAPFFSIWDCQVQRTAFQGACNVGLLFSYQDAPEPHVDLFGWRRGQITQRGFYVVGEDRKRTASSPS